MKTLLIIICALCSSIFTNINDGGTQIALEKSNNSTHRSISVVSKEFVEASLDYYELSIDISNYSGTVYYQIEDIDGNCYSGYTLISGSGQITKDLSLLEPGFYTIKIQAGCFYIGTFSL